ncbi:hypothetical protein KRP22_001237 [Phytophthora ramorum]|nr:hypothetical protein KRP22_26 [Phytophthora ramorum]
MDRTFPEQLSNTEANTNKELKLRREMACEKHVRQLEITRRRTTIAAASQSFFDRLALLSVRESIHAFEAQREALLNFCLQQFCGEVDAYELDTIHRDVVQMIAKAQHELQNKFARQEKDESHVAQKKIALQQLKKYQHEQIEQHLANSKEQRKQELAARDTHRDSTLTPSWFALLETRRTNREQRRSSQHISTGRPGIESAVPNAMVV